MTSIWEVITRSPTWVHHLVVLALTLHIGGGSIAILSGFTAAFAPKGGQVHRRAGQAFVAAMFLMTTMAVAIASFTPQRGNVAGGILSFYLVATGWAAVRRKPGTVGRFETIACTAVSLAAAGLLILGWQASQSPTGRLNGLPPALFFAFGALGAFFAFSDLAMIRRGGVAGVQRTARHLGRMCFALFIASGSFFIGQQKVMPTVIHGSPLLFVLGLAPLALMLFWLVKVRLKRRRLAPVAAAA